jgi:hypothetical protein
MSDGLGSLGARLLILTASVPSVGTLPNAMNEIPTSAPPDYGGFVAGIRHNLIRCIWVGNPQLFLTREQKLSFALFFLLYTFLPLIAVPVWAIVGRNWWRLLGIPAAYFGVFLGARAAARGQKAANGGFLPFVFIGLWWTEGLKSNETICALCATWGWALYLIADAAQGIWAEQTILSDPSLYERAVSEGHILVIPRRR